MGYYLRVLSTSSDCVPVSSLEAAIKEKHLSAKLVVDAGTHTEWDQLILTHLDGTEIASIERNVVEGGSLGAEELEEFRDEVVGFKPESAAKWLIEFMSGVRCIYAFQVLGGTEIDTGWNVLDAVRWRIFEAGPSVLQADLEGFSNSEGYHILWQFDEYAKGPWQMAVLQNGEWIKFQMELSDERQREAFIRGEVPEGIQLGT